LAERGTSFQKSRAAGWFVVDEQIPNFLIIHKGVKLGGAVPMNGGMGILLHFEKEAATRLRKPCWGWRDGARVFEEWG
jgi:hypothetical protein